MIGDDYGAIVATVFNVVGRERVIERALWIAGYE